MRGQVEVCLQSLGFQTERMLRVEYQHDNALSYVRDYMASCAGAVVLGFCAQACGLPSDAQAAGITPWCHVEAGMAIGLRMPVLLLHEEGVSAGAFSSAVKGHNVHLAALPLVDGQLPQAWSNSVKDGSLPLA